jgi:hypothetical protein
MKRQRSANYLILFPVNRCLPVESDMTDRPVLIHHFDLTQNRLSKEKFIGLMNVSFGRVIRTRVCGEPLTDYRCDTPSEEKIRSISLCEWRNQYWSSNVRSSLCWSIISFHCWTWSAIELDTDEDKANTYGSSQNSIQLIPFQQMNTRKKSLDRDSYQRETTDEDFIEEFNSDWRSGGEHSLLLINKKSPQRIDLISLDSFSVTKSQTRLDSKGTSTDQWRAWNWSQRERERDSLWSQPCSRCIRPNDHGPRI